MRKLVGCIRFLLLLSVINSQKMFLKWSHVYNYVTPLYLSWPTWSLCNYFSRKNGQHTFPFFASTNTDVHFSMRWLYNYIIYIPPFITFLWEGKYRYTADNTDNTDVHLWGGQIIHPLPQTHEVFTCKHLHIILYTVLNPPF